MVGYALWVQTLPATSRHAINTGRRCRRFGPKSMKSSQREDQPHQRRLCHAIEKTVESIEFSWVVRLSHTWGPNRCALDLD